MWAKKLEYATVFYFLCCAGVRTHNVENSSKIGIENVLGCLESDMSISCLTMEASRALEHSMNKTVSLFGINLIRNEKKLNFRAGKSLGVPDRFLRAIADFFDTHSFSLALTEPRSQEPSPRRGGGGLGGAGNGGLFNMNSKAVRREKKYYQYAFMVLLGIFGLTGPLVMQVLGAMAAKSLLAAKTALIIVGGVALKKLFENGGDKSPKVKVVTLPLRKDEYESEEDHDRWGYGFNHIPHGYRVSGTWGGYKGNNPYSSYYDGSVNEKKGGYASVIYGTQQRSEVTNSR